MIHPLVIAVWLADAVAVILLFVAAVRAEPVVRQWSAGDASRRQLTLERNLEAVSLLARLGALTFAASSAGLLLALTAVLPAVVPGAMCGTGVVEAAAAEWPLVLRGVALLAVAAWATLERLDRAAPRAPLARWTAGVLLPVAPVTAWAAWQTALALARLDGQAAVDCCAAMYAEAAVAAEAATGPEHLGVDGVLFGAGAAVIVVVGLISGLARRPPKTVVPATLGVLTLGWIVLAAEVLVTHLAAYHYEVLAHHCPWCLFLPEHGSVGYLLFGALAVAALESVAAVTSAAAARAAPGVDRDAGPRARRASLRIGIAVMVFVAAAAGPALVWWMRFGVWL